MASTITITLLDVDSGDSLPLSLPLAATANDLKSLAEEYIAIPQKRMILLRSEPPFLRIEPTQILNDGAEIFLFNKTSFSKSRAPSASPSLREESLFQDRPPLTQTASRSGPPPSSPMVRAVYEYERVVLENAARGASLLQWASLGVEASDDVASRARVQSRASRAAVGNLQTHNAALQALFERFDKMCAAKLAAHASVLDSFETDLERVDAMTRRDTGGRLLEATHTEQVRRWASEARKQRGLIESKADEVRQAVRQLEVEASAEVGIVAETEADDVVAGMQALLGELQALCNTLHQDADEVQQLVDDMSNANELAVQLEARVRARQAELAALHRVEAELASKARELRQIRVRVHSSLGVALRQVSQLESRIEVCNNTVAALKEGLAVQDALVAQVEVVKKLPQAYQAGLAEVRRRLAFGRQYRARIDVAAEALAKVRDEEVLRRETFAREHGKVLKFELFPGLANSGVPPCEISQRPFDEDLAGMQQQQQQQSEEEEGEEPELWTEQQQQHQGGVLIIPASTPTRTPELDLAQALATIDELKARIKQLELMDRPE